MIDRSFWEKRRVFLTGHTGFKGAWATLLLRSLGAQVYGFALPPEGSADLFVVAGVADGVQHELGDIRNPQVLRDAVARARPEIVIHMAAQSLVRRSYAEPVETYATNVMGTVNLLEAVRHTSSVQAVVVVTTDKCYKNAGWVWGYRENDTLGGHDPYSNSKACAELVTEAYRNSFFHADGVSRIASARAGNVIGGGDWASDRIVPDAVRAFTSGKKLRVRNPRATRPWQHVFDPLVGYLSLCERLAAGDNGFAEAWNFGPSASSEVPVATLIDGFTRRWGRGACWERDLGEHPHEAAYLKLDCSKAISRLGWRPSLDLNEALDLTVDWYRAFHDGADIRAFSLQQINEFLAAHVPAVAQKIEA